MVCSKYPYVQEIVSLNHINAITICSQEAKPYFSFPLSPWAHVCERGEILYSSEGVQLSCDELGKDAVM